MNWNTAKIAFCLVVYGLMAVGCWGYSMHNAFASEHKLPLPVLIAIIYLPAWTLSYLEEWIFQPQPQPNHQDFKSVMQQRSLAG